MAWTDEDKQKVVDMYTAKNPTPENSIEIVEEIATELGDEYTVNGVRIILVKAGVYVKKSADTVKAGAKAAGTGSKRVSKADSIAELTSAIEEIGAEVDEEILSKLTGKAAIYFTGVLKTVSTSETEETDTE